MTGVRMLPRPSPLHQSRARSMLSLLGLAVVLTAVQKATASDRGAVINVSFPSHVFPGHRSRTLMGHQAWDKTEGPLILCEDQDHKKLDHFVEVALGSFSLGTTV